MGKGVRHHASLRLPLHGVVADGGGGLQRGVDIAGLKEAVFLFGTVGPDAGKTIGLQFDAHLNAIGARPPSCRLLRALGLFQDAEFVLNVMADLVRDHIGLGKFAGLAGATAEALLDLAKKRSVQIDAPVRRTVEWPHRRLRNATMAAVRSACEYP